MIRPSKSLSNGVAKSEPARREPARTQRAVPVASPKPLPPPNKSRAERSLLLAFRTLQTKPAAVSSPSSQKPATSSQRHPVAPQVYRPQPTPKVLQTKTRVSAPQGLTPAAAPAMASRGQKATPVNDPLKPPNLAYVGGRRLIIQRFTSRVIQAVKFYPNLHPGAVEPIDPSNVFKLDSFANQYRLRKVNSHGVNVPNQQYNFVRTSDGEMLLHSRYRHPSIAEGKQVLYAGEIFFNNGQLQWWSNGSGHYQPYAEDAEQASLPMDQFFSYQQIIKGEHTRKS
jgi:hypothetical protein